METSNYSRDEISKCDLIIYIQREHLVTKNPGDRSLKCFSIELAVIPLIFWPICKFDLALIKDSSNICKTIQTIFLQVICIKDLDAML